MVIKTVSVSKPRPPRLPALLREVASPPGVATQARRAAAAAPPPARSPTAVQPLKVSLWAPAPVARPRRCPPRPLSVAPTIDTLLRSRAPHASSAEVIVVRASSTNVARHRHDARLKRDAELEAGDVIDLGAPRLLRQKPPVRKPGRAVPARPLYTPNPRLYPGSGTKQKPRPKRSEARGNDGRGRRHKRVYRRPVPNPRLYRPAPPRAPPPPAWPRTTWPTPTPAARLETASRVALRLNEQRPWTRAPQRPLRTAYLPVQPDRSLVRAAHSPVRAVRSPVRAVPSPVRTFRSPVRPVRPPVRAVRPPIRAVSSPVRAVRSPVRADRAPVRAVRSPVRAARSPEQAERSPERAWCQLPPSPAHESSTSRRLVVTLPAPPAEPAPRYRPAGEHVRLRSLDTDSGVSTPVAALAAARAAPPAAAVPAMDAGNRQSTSPEDCSEGNETLSAPSEFLAEFLSAIMRRQYAEALKYCRLILQYEPHNATARGFYPLLQHKVQAHERAEDGWARGSSSEEASAHADKPQHAAPPGAQEMMEQGADESDGSAATSRGASRSSSRSRGSCASQSSLELDSSDALAHSSPSLSLSRRTDSASAGCWESTGSASRSEPDDNGNAPASLPACAADVQNDNAAAPHKGESAASLRRLRAQFACSTK